MAVHAPCTWKPIMWQPIAPLHQLQSKSVSLIGTIRMMKEDIGVVLTEATKFATHAMMGDVPYRIVAISMSVLSALETKRL